MECTILIATVPWDILTTTQMSVIVYNDGTGYISLYEVHGSVMSPASHRYNHLTNGTKLVSVASLSGSIVINGTTVTINYYSPTSTFGETDITQYLFNYISVTSSGDGNVIVIDNEKVVIYDDPPTEPGLYDLWLDLE